VATIDALLPVFDIQVGNKSGAMVGIGEAALGRICPRDIVEEDGLDARQAVQLLGFEESQPSRAYFQHPEASSVYFIPPL
jgi:hypothetical protein